LSKNLPERFTILSPDFKQTTGVMREEAAARAPANDGMKEPSTQSDFASGQWSEAQDELARAADLAVLLVAGHQPPALTLSNNNSICRTLQSSPAHAHLCEPYCGKAYERAYEAGRATHYRCHAGLNCYAVPVEIEGRKLAVIAGRAFVSSADYRALAERVRAGDLKDLPLPELFNNVIFTEHSRLEHMPARVSALVAEHNHRVGAGNEIKDRAPRTKEAMAISSAVRETLPEVSTTQINFPPGSSLRDACRAALESLVAAHNLSSVAVFLKLEEKFTSVYVTEEFVSHPPRITQSSAKSDKSNSETTTRRGGNRKVSIVAANREQLRVEWDLPVNESRIGIFPLIVGEETRGALIVGASDSSLSEDTRRTAAQFSRELALPLEVLRLREELERRVRAAYHLQSFTERVNSVEPEEAYTAILRHSVDLLHAERGSLQLYDEESNQLEVKAAMGPRAEITREARTNVSEGVAGVALREGRPVVVRDIVESSGIEPASPERLYKTNSFISYPIIVSGRRVGVLNVTDKTGGSGESFSEKDVNLLDMIAPQMALALDRAEWHQKATQFQLLSITDPLTDLLNRRYLEERLGEEVERSRRYRYAMSFMMIDIDDFKIYNDRNGHQAGDLALEMTAQTLKSALRSADVAARYGGEEFSVLLPQTSLAEAHVIAERIRRRVERTRYPHGKSQPLGAVTISVGLSTFSPALDTAQVIIGAADQALYVAKSLGKNRVEAYRSPSAPSDEATTAGDNEK
jgi:diguanylate cyclase (GGDEF)-like protein